MQDLQQDRTVPNIRLLYSEPINAIGKSFQHSNLHGTHSKVTPEKMLSPDFLLLLARLYNRNRINRFVIDEVQLSFCLALLSIDSH